MLRIRISLVVAAGALLVAFGVTLLLINTVRLHHDAQATSRSDAYLVAVIDVEKRVVDAETGLRGYVITGQPVFLAPTRSAQTSLPAAETALTRAAAADGAFRGDAALLVRQSRSFVTGYVPAVERIAAGDRRQAQTYALTIEGKRLVDEVRATTTSLERMVSARERARQDGAQSEAAHATTEAIIVLVLLTVLTLLLGGFLGRLVISRERARGQAEATTTVLRQSLLPSAVPSITDCELAVRFIPARAGDLVGGDFYDVFSSGPGHWVVIVGDVCGKGSDAAAVTAMARWILRGQAMSGATPADALRFLNHTMLSLDLNGRFVTVAYLLLTVEGGRAHASLACGGHPPGILVPAVGTPAVLPARGTLLGVWPEVHLRTEEIALGPGDGIVLYTDGVSDPGPGPERVPAEALSERPPAASADQLADALQAYAAEPSGPQRDDIAIVAVRFVDSGGGRGVGECAGNRSSRADGRSGAGGGGDAEASGGVVVAAGEESADHVEQLLDPVGGVQDRLVPGDVITERAHLGDVQRPDLGAPELVDLAEGGEQPGAVGARLAGLEHDAELDREPEHGGEEVAPGLRLQPPGGPAGEAVELGQPGTGEQAAVADHLVDEIRLRGVQRAGVMADVLGGVKDAVGQRAVELIEADQPRRRVVLKAGQRR